MPAFLRLGLHDLLAKARSELSGSEWLGAFLDTAYIVTSWARGRDAFDAVAKSIKEGAGIDANMGKCRAVSAAGGDTPLYSRTKHGRVARSLSARREWAGRAWRPFEHDRVYRAASEEGESVRVLGLAAGGPRLAERPGIRGSTKATLRPRTDAAPFMSSRMPMWEPLSLGALAG